MPTGGLAGQGPWSQKTVSQGPWPQKTVSQGPWPLFVEQEVKDLGLYSRSPLELPPVSARRHVAHVMITGRNLAERTWCLGEKEIIN